MNYIRRRILTTSVLFAGFITVNAQTADEIIAKHIEAVGGEANWKKVKSIKLTGSMNAGGIELPITITTLDKKGYRMEFSMNGIANYTVLTPEKGWMFFPTQGQTTPQAMPDEMVKEQQDQLDVTMDPLIDYKTKGNKVTYLGKDQVEGTECYKIKVVHANGKEETLFIDISSYYVIRTVEKSKANGQEQEDITNAGNYQKTPEGIVFPMSIDGGGTPVTIKTIEVNKPVDEKIFTLADIKK